ncbi:MAG TPA: porin family protein [Steroidobacteraceae bacterium]|nr:porin family protein [Steroidobacteraceae bacterium]
MASRITVASLAAIGLLAGSLAQAATPGRYSGIAIGATGIDVDSTGFDESDVGFKWFGGIMVTPNIGLELAYIFGGTLDSSSGPVRSVESNAFTIEGVGSIPLGEKFALYAKAGIGFYDAYVATRVGTYYSNSDEDFIYGAGGSLAINKKFELRLEWQQLGFSTSAYKGDFSMLSLGFAYRF